MIQSYPEKKHVGTHVMIYQDHYYDVLAVSSDKNEICKIPLHHIQRALSWWNNACLRTLNLMNTLTVDVHDTIPLSHQTVCYRSVQQGCPHLRTSTQSWSNSEPWSRNRHWLDVACCLGKWFSVAFWSQLWWLKSIISQQTQDIEPLLGQCWASVVDAGPTLNQRWFNASW